MVYGNQRFVKRIKMYKVIAEYKFDGFQDEIAEFQSYHEAVDFIMQNSRSILEPVESLSNYPEQVVEVFHNKDLFFIIESFWQQGYKSSCKGEEEYYEDEYRDRYGYSDDFRNLWSEIFFSTQSIMSYYCPAGPTKFLADSTNFWHLGILRSLTGK